MMKPPKKQPEENKDDREMHDPRNTGSRASIPRTIAQARQDGLYYAVIRGFVESNVVPENDSMALHEAIESLDSLLLWDDSTDKSPLGELVEQNEILAGEYQNIVNQLTSETEARLAAEQKQAKARGLVDKFLKNWGTIDEYSIESLEAGFKYDIEQELAGVQPATELGYKFQQSSIGTIVDNGGKSNLSRFFSPFETVKSHVEDILELGKHYVIEVTAIVTERIKEPEDEFPPDEPLIDEEDEESMQDDDEDDSIDPVDEYESKRSKPTAEIVYSKPGQTADCPATSDHVHHYSNSSPNQCVRCGKQIERRGGPSTGLYPTRACEEICNNEYNPESIECKECRELDVVKNDEDSTIHPAKEFFEASK
jgi:hypothetical protein